ncbi:MAG: NAD kinase [Bacteroidia bacterium]
MRIAIYGRSIVSDQYENLNKLLTAFQRAGAEVLLYKPLRECMASAGFETNEAVFDGQEALDPGLDFFVTIGGDGTLLDAVSWVRNRGIPVLGINFGRLGFLTSVAPSKIKEAVDQLFRANYTIEKRSMVCLKTSEPLFGDTPYALNEFAIHKKDIASMIKIRAFLNGEFLNSYYADGLVVATPTGSTGYSISCGGPIILPDSPVMVITPVAPHNLNVRPVVVPDNATLSFEVEGMGNQFLASLDARMATIDRSIQLELVRNKFDFLLVRLNDNTHLKTMRSKLLWGIDKRN